LAARPCIRRDVSVHPSLDGEGPGFVNSPDSKDDPQFLLPHKIVVEKSRLITLIDCEENRESGCKLLKDRLRTVAHQQKSSKIVC
jgi:hypothetical protein